MLGNSGEKSKEKEDWEQLGCVMDWETKNNLEKCLTEKTNATCKISGLMEDGSYEVHKLEFNNGVTCALKYFRFYGEEKIRENEVYKELSSYCSIGNSKFVTKMVFALPDDGIVVLEYFYSFHKEFTSSLGSATSERRSKKIYGLAMNGDLNNPAMAYHKEMFAKYFSYQILLALKYFESFGCIYTDLKPENILIDKKNYLIKFCDLGSFLNCVQRPFVNLHHGYPTTSKYYYSPKKEEYDIKVGLDVQRAVAFSFGIIIYRLMFVKHPFKNIFYTGEDMKKEEDIKRVRKEIESKECISQDLKKLLLALFSIDFRDRPTIDEIFKFDWFIRNKKSLETLMKEFGPDETDKLLDPEDKFTGEKIKNMLVHDFFEGHTDDNIANEDVRTYNENAKKIYLLNNKKEVLNHIKETFLSRIKHIESVIFYFYCSKNKVKVNDGTIEASIVSELKSVIKKDLKNIFEKIFKWEGKDDKEEIEKKYDKLLQSIELTKTLEDIKMISKSLSTEFREEFENIHEHFDNSGTLGFSYPEISLKLGSNSKIREVEQLELDSKFYLEEIHKQKESKEEELKKKSINAMDQNGSFDQNSLFGRLKKIAEKDMEKRKREEARIDALEQSSSKENVFEKLELCKRKYRSKSENRVPKRDNHVPKKIICVSDIHI